MFVAARVLLVLLVHQGLQTGLHRIAAHILSRLSSAGDPVPKRRGASGGSRVPPSGSGVGNGHRVRGEPRDEVLPLYGVFVPPLPELVGKSL